MPAHVSEMKIMNRKVEQNVKLEEIAKAIWESKAIMGLTDRCETQLLLIRL
jgi:hypothetical protein